MTHQASSILRLTAILAALTFVTVPAFAADSLAICESGVPYVWPNGGVNIPFNPDQGDLRAGVIDNPTGVALVQQAFDRWTAVATSTVSYTNAGLLPVDVDDSNFGPFLDPVAPDGLSAIVFDADGAIFDILFGPGSGILGFAGPEWLDTVNCEILEGLSFLNGPAFDDLTAAEDVMAHEYGHYSNLGHVELNGQLLVFGEGGDDTGPTPDNTTFGPPPPFGGTEITETMYPFYFGPTVGTRTPHADDIASISTLYPSADFAATTGSITGTIRAPNGDALSGVNVIARNVANPFVDAVSTFSGAFTDNTDPSDPNVGVFALNGLTPGAEYKVFVDAVTAQAGRFSNPILVPLPGPEEFYNGASESSDPEIDDPLDMTSLTAVAGSPLNGIDIIFNQSGPGGIDIGDDDSVELFMPFAFEICGESFNSVFVNSNGSLSFGVGDTSFIESEAAFLAGPPRIAALWDDLSPNNGGSVSFSETSNTFSVRFENVPEFFATGANTFEFTLHRASNHIDIAYGNMSAADGLAGVSCGGAITSGAEAGTDLSAFGNSTINLHNQPAVFELFNFGNPNDLANTSVEYNGTTDYDDSWAEPNDSLGAARQIQLPFDSTDVVRFTEIEPTGGDVDFYRMSADPGQTLIAEVVAGQLDSLLGLFDSAGNLIAVDDDGGTGLLSKIQAEVPADGDVFLAVTTFPDGGFTGAGGSGGRYVLDVFAINGVPLTLGDDNSVEVTLGFSFPFQGASYTSAFVNSNGNLTFGSGDSDFTESVAELLSDQPRIAALWNDLSPNAGGQVLLERDTGSATVSFTGVPQFPSTGSNTFAVTLEADGSVSIVYGAVDTTSSLVGVSEGGGAADPGETDLSAAAGLSVDGTTYEVFTFGDVFDLSGSTLPFDP